MGEAGVANLVNAFIEAGAFLLKRDERERESGNVVAVFEEAAQIVIVFLLPMVLGFLVVLAASSLPAPNRLHGWYLGLVITAATATCACAVLGAIHGIL